MKKELKKHISSNSVETDIRKLTRNVFRKEPIDMIIGKNDSTDVKIDGVQVTPEFAAVVDRILGESKNKAERLKAMMEMTEIWTPPVEKAKPEEKKPKKTRKKKKKLDVAFKPAKVFKDLGLEIEFISDIDTNE